MRRNALSLTLTAILALFVGTTGLYARDPGAGEGERAPNDPRSARFALVQENRTGEIAGQALLDAATTVLVSHPGTFWFELAGIDPSEIARYQAEVLAVLSAEADPESSESGTYRVGLQFFPPHGDLEVPLSEAFVMVQLDRGGRYQRTETWTLFLRSLDQILPEARPVVPVTIRSRSPITLSGLPEWLIDEYVERPSRSIDLDLRTLRDYRVLVEAPGYRSRELSFYVERQPMNLEISLRKYPRHTVALTARGVSWPGLEYTWYDRSTRWTAFIGVTTFAWGLTPLRQFADVVGYGDAGDREKARTVTSYPLSEVEVGAGRLLGDRDRPARWYLSAAGLARITHGDLDTGLEPVSPTALRLGIGRERELPWRMILSHRVANDFFWPVETSFLRDVPWSTRIGPVLWQLPVYRLGLRVVL